MKDTIVTENNYNSQKRTDSYSRHPIVSISVRENRRRRKKVSPKQSGVSLFHEELKERLKAHHQKMEKERERYNATP
jgi:hypothetical protein